MHAFSYGRASRTGAAIAAVVADSGASFLAGGTAMLDLISYGIERPAVLIDINALPLDRIDDDAERLRIGALARLNALADSTALARAAPVLAQAAAASASPQLRNMATIGGNLLQRTRCPYYRDVATPCNKRRDGEGCSALNGVNRDQAILGTSDRCIATHPSDPAVAVAALDAVVITEGPNETSRRIPLVDFHTLPEPDPTRDHVLERGELIVAIELPRTPFAARSHYLKVRDRSSYEFALVSVAAALALDGERDGTGARIAAARIALGGVAPKPWRAFDAERHLEGRAPTDAAFAEAAEIALRAVMERGER